MTSLNHKCGDNSNDKYTSQNMVKAQIVSLNDKHGKNSNNKYKS